MEEGESRLSKTANFHDFRRPGFRVKKSDRMRRVPRGASQSPKRCASFLSAHPIPDARSAMGMRSPGHWFWSLSVSAVPIEGARDGRGAERLVIFESLRERLCPSRGYDAPRCARRILCVFLIPKPGGSGMRARVRLGCRKALPVWLAVFFPADRGAVEAAFPCGAWERGGGLCALCVASLRPLRYTAPKHSPACRGFRGLL